MQLNTHTIFLNHVYIFRMKSLIDAWL